MILSPIVNKKTPFGCNIFFISKIKYFITTIVLINFKAPVVDPAEPPIKRRKKINVCDKWGHVSKSSVP